MCWGVGEVRGDVGKGEVREMLGSVGGSVLEPHTLTHFLTPPPFLSPHANTLPHSPHTLSHTPTRTFPLPTHLSSPPNTLPYTSPHTLHTSSHSSPDLPLHPSTLTPRTLPHLYPHLPHSFDYVTKLPCDDAPDYFWIIDDVTLISLIGKAR